MQVSIIICCYNSAARIQATLEHIACQALDVLTCELILVDNNCTDNTVAVTQQVWSDCGNPFSLRIVEEKQAGLSYARKAGFAKSKGTVILYCDDDNWLNENYVSTVINNFKSMPEVGIIGGIGIEKTVIEPPKWFNDMKGRYAIGSGLAKSGYVSNVYGAGMAVRRIVLEQFYSHFISHMSDRKGASLSAGGDTEICFASTFFGYNIYWDIDNSFIHFIPKERLSFKYITRLIKGNAETQAKLVGLKTIVSKTTYEMHNKLLNDIWWIIKNLPGSLMNKKITWYLLWSFHRISFWWHVLNEYKEFIKSFHEEYWFKKNSC